jgi:hypothetical protein
MRGLAGLTPEEDAAIDILRSARDAVLPFLNCSAERDIFLLALKVAQHCVMRLILARRGRGLPKVDPAWRELRQEVVRISLNRSK